RGESRAGSDALPRRRRFWARAGPLSISTRHIARHEHEVPGAAGTVHDEVVEQALPGEAEALEGAERARLVRRHPGHELAQPALARDGGDLAGQLAAEPARAAARPDVDPDLAEVPLPADLVVQERRVTGHGSAALRDHHDRPAVVRALDPARHRVEVGDVDAEEEQVVGRKLARER